MSSHTGIPNPEHQTGEEETTQNLAMNISGDSVCQETQTMLSQGPELLVLQHRPGQSTVQTSTAGKATLSYMCPAGGSAGYS